jgi:phospholipid-binding lipoprotein MlaA
MYVFNDKLDRYLLKPVAQGYRAALPQPVRTGVSNFFSNLREPVVMVNDALQGKFKNAASDFGRFLTNTTLGVFGLFDVASHFGLDRHYEDLGQTLGVWGVGEGPYLVLPLFGPSNFRDGVGLYGDLQLYPPHRMEEQSTAWKLYAVDVIDTRARLLDAGDILEQAAGQDPYVFVREAYRQRRRSLIQDGGTGAPAPLDPSIFEDDRPASKPGAPKSQAKPGS